MLRENDRNYMTDGDYYFIPLKMVLDRLNLLGKQNSITTEEMQQKHLLHDLFIGKLDYPFETGMYRIPKYGCDLVACFPEFDITEDMIAVACYRARKENRKQLFRQLEHEFDLIYELQLQGEAIDGVFDRIRQNDFLFEYITKYASFHDYLMEKNCVKRKEQFKEKENGQDYQKIKTDAVILNEKRTGERTSA